MTPAPVKPLKVVAAFPVLDEPEADAVLVPEPEALEPDAVELPLEDEPDEEADEEEPVADADPEEEEESPKLKLVFVVEAEPDEEEELPRVLVEVIVASGTMSGINHGNVEWSYLLKDPEGVPEEKGADEVLVDPLEATPN